MLFLAINLVVKHMKIKSFIVASPDYYFRHSLCYYLSMGKTHSIEIFVTACGWPQNEQGKQ